VLLITWLIVGLVAGLLATAFTKKGYGLFGDLVVGMVGAILGSWAVGAFAIQTPLDGWLRTITVAFFGAATLLILLRVSRPRRRFAWSR
jgi:uncharacterized membrane protein YeaQ/YmgE (transglycosylase-associated protein family)